MHFLYVSEGWKHEISFGEKENCFLFFVLPLFTPNKRKSISFLTQKLVMRMWKGQFIVVVAVSSLFERPLRLSCTGKRGAFCLLSDSLSLLETVFNAEVKLRNNLLPCWTERAVLTVQLLNSGFAQLFHSVQKWSHNDASIAVSFVQYQALQGYLRMEMTSCVEHDNI